MMRRLSYWWRYLRSDIPWDTGVTPPELTSLVEQEHLPPGRAIDLGCGSGTNSIYLAEQGWTVIGVDYIAKPIKAANARAERAGVADRTCFVVRDVLALGPYCFSELFDLALDIGCCHSLARNDQQQYASVLSTLMRPGGTLLLYMFRPTLARSLGLTPEDVQALFSPNFSMKWSSCGEDFAAGVGSAWYRLQRV